MNGMMDGVNEWSSEGMGVRGEPCIVVFLGDVMMECLIERFINRSR